MAHLRNEQLNFPKFLKVAAFPWKKLLPFRVTTDFNETFHVVDAHVIRLLKDALHFNFTILLPTEGTYGVSLPDGNWTGLVGMVQREEADIGIGELSISESRATAVDFSYPYGYASFNFITDKPEYLPDSSAAIHPFSMSLWIAVVTSLFIVMLLSFLLKSKKDDFSILILDTYGSLLEKGVRCHFHKPSIKLLLFSWIFGAMFLTFSYKAVLLSFLTFPTATGIRSIPDLSRASTESTFNCSTYPGSYVHDTILHSEDETWKKIGECFNRNTRLTADFEQFLKRSRYKKAFIGIKAHLKPFARDYFISDDSFFITRLAIAVRKSFCCKDALNRVVNRFAAAGLLQKYDRDTEFFYSLGKTWKTKEASDPNRKLSLQDMSAAFVCLGSGCILASAVLMLEVFLCRKLYGGKTLGCIFKRQIKKLPKTLIRLRRR